SRDLLVAKKKKKKNLPAPRSAPIRPPSQPRFAVGDHVRVRAGVVDPDYPDIPLGGWAGVIVDYEDDEDEGWRYNVEWTQETLAQIHPIHFHRARRAEVDPS